MSPKRPLSPVGCGVCVCIATVASRKYLHRFRSLVIYEPIIPFRNVAHPRVLGVSDSKPCKAPQVVTCETKIHSAMTPSIGRGGVFFPTKHLI